MPGQILIGLDPSDVSLNSNSRTQRGLSRKPRTHLLLALLQVEEDEFIVCKATFGEGQTDAIGVCRAARAVESECGHFRGAWEFSDKSQALVELGHCLSSLSRLSNTCYVRMERCKECRVVIGEFGFRAPLSWRQAEQYKSFCLAIFVSTRCLLPTRWLEKESLRYEARR